MTPPVLPPSGVTPLQPFPEIPSGVDGVGGRGSLSGAETYASSPALNLRPDLENPIRASNQRPIRTLGDVRDTIVLDFFGRHLFQGGRGVRIVQQLGSFPGFLEPQKPFQKWNPDQKPDFNVIGDARVILEAMAPMMKWNHATLEANILRAEQGMAYFNLALETPHGPIPFKLGILGMNQWEAGSHPYYDLRASLLPIAGPFSSYRYFDLPRDGAPSGLPHVTELPEAEKNRLLQIQANFLRRSMETFVWRRSFGARLIPPLPEGLNPIQNIAWRIGRRIKFGTGNLVWRRYRNQFVNYEMYRVFDYTKGPRQAARYGDQVAQILVPPLKLYLETHGGALQVSHPELGVLAADQITPENFSQLTFTWQRSFGERLRRYFAVQAEFLGINRRMARQTFRNIASNGTVESKQKVTWLEYGLRKFERFFGIENTLHTTSYEPSASLFPKSELDPTVELRARLGQTGQPVQKFLIMAGYDAGNESDPAVYQDILKYARGELQKGAIPSPLFKGTNPSKFNLSFRGIPAVYYQLTNALYSQGAQETVLVGCADTQEVFDAFLKINAEEIARRGKVFKFVPEVGSFTKNMRAGYGAFAGTEGPVVVGFGDTPLIDLERMVFHPRRLLADWVVSPNSKTAMTHDGFKNYHVEGSVEEVRHPAKEGNLYIFPGNSQRIPWHLLQAIFDSRKSMADGGRSKLSILGEVLFGSGWTDIRRYPPQVYDSLHFISDFVGGALSQEGSLGRVGDALAKRGFSRIARVFRTANRFNPAPEGKKVPPVAIGVESAEHLFRSRLDFPSSITPGDHTDPGGVLDVDGLFDLVLGKLAIEETAHPEKVFPHWEKIADHGEKLRELGLHIPTPEAEAERSNALQERLRKDLLAEGFSEERLRKGGFAEGMPPLLPDGAVNPDYVNAVIGSREAGFVNQAFEAYYHRGEHAQALAEDISTALLVSPRLAKLGFGEAVAQNFVFEQLSIDPERARSLLIEQSPDRLIESLLVAGRKKFGESSSGYLDLATYLQRSLNYGEGRADTSFRRVLTGMKAVEILRRNVANLAPAEFQKIYPTLVESMVLAQETIAALPGAKKFAPLSRYFALAEKTADRTYVQEVGESPPPYRHREAGRWLPHSNRQRNVERNTRGDITVVRGAAMAPGDYHQIAVQLDILPSRVSHVVAAAAGAHSAQNLDRIPSSRMTAERVLRWAQTVPGQNFLREQGAALKNNFSNRLREGGPGLAVGLGSVFLLAPLSDALGLDRQWNPHERFAFEVGAGHLLSTATNSVNEVFFNRALGTPFSYATASGVSGGSEAALQLRFHASSTLSRDLSASLLRNFQGGSTMGRAAWSGAKGALGLPFRASWNMGPGLMSAALVDKIFSEGLLGLNPESRLRQGIHMGAFFLPDVYRIAVPQTGPSMFRSRPMKLASRAFAVGFMADMAFTGAMRLGKGSYNAVADYQVYQLADHYHDQPLGGFSGMLNGTLEFMAPNLMSWWDSVEWQDGGFKPNSHLQRARSEVALQTQDLERQVVSQLQSIFLNGRDGEKYQARFYQSVDFGFLRQNLGASTIRADAFKRLKILLSKESLAQSFFSCSDQAAQVKWVQNRLSAYSLSETEVSALLAQLTIESIRSQGAALQQIVSSRSEGLGKFFDEHGRVNSGYEMALLGEVLGTDVDVQKLLQMRRYGLYARLSQLRSGAREQEPGERAQLEAVARQLEQAA